MKDNHDKFTDTAKLQKENRRLRWQLQRARQQRDAAITDLRHLAHQYCPCYACDNDKFDYDKDRCTGCFYNNRNHWQWRGLPKGKTTEENSGQMTKERACQLLEFMAVDMTGRLGGMSHNPATAKALQENIQAINVAQRALKKNRR